MMLRKMVFGVLGLFLLAHSGLSFFFSRRMEEQVVLSPGVTVVKTLGD